MIVAAGQQAPPPPLPDPAQSPSPRQRHVKYVTPFPRMAAKYGRSTVYTGEEFLAANHGNIPSHTTLLW